MRSSQQRDRGVLSPPPGPCASQRLLNWMLALACQRGHLEVVKLLVLTHGADPENYAVRKNEFPVIVRLPLYAAIKAGGSHTVYAALQGSHFPGWDSGFTATVNSPVACERTFCNSLFLSPVSVCVWGGGCAAVCAHLCVAGQKYLNFAWRVPILLSWPAPQPQLLTVPLQLPFSLHLSLENKQGI